MKRSVGSGNVSPLELWTLVFPAASLLALRFVWLALPLSLLLLMGAGSLARMRQRGAYRPGLMLSLSAPVVTAALLLFVVREAAPGVIRGGHEATARQAVSRLRTILFAQDAVRRAGWIDPDGDGVGSAAFVSELCSGHSKRAGAEPRLPWLRCDAIVESALGPAIAEGAYRYTVCIPQEGGAFSAVPSDGTAYEASERRYVAYAWPEGVAGLRSTFALDEKENILVGVDVSKLTCESALGSTETGQFTNWRGKRAREQLPGDTREQ